MKNIAVIGAGVSGLTTAYLLSQKHKVQVFEKNDYIGGHTATVDVEHAGKQHVIDTGFIVFNDKTYPNFLKLLDNIGIKKQETEMSFSVHNCQTGLEYNGHNLDTLFAQRRNIFRPKFWRLISQILRFNKLCKAAYSANDFDLDLTLGEFLHSNSFDDYFSEHYILPMGAAIWSSSLEQMQGFQFKFFVQFFNNHGLLNIADRPQWYVIPKGSRSYIAPLIEGFKDNIELNSSISKVTRAVDGVQLHFGDKRVMDFDEVVFACHSDQALALLGDATDDEKSILGAIEYSANDVVLHTDISLLPKRRKAWASWNYQLSDNRSKPASVTYNMNILQGLKEETTFCVTLNQNEDIAPAKVLRKYVYHHPIFNVASLNAQQLRNTICGLNNTHFVGAYWYNGFHEDGVKSAVDVGQRFSCSL
ncbi:NAD(P)/FAD-dependent oxidoreductase [Thalassotalea crassostreae]|uniref:NAD(P)/FAD-dependent oxidoreductase n=1 Tax=Thalassotalea crassostreae TaxID=1763536 RepID=UPI0009ECF284|nr:FAD-dependent oxidoreductase [Thalassotalea crassostreae]